MGESEQRQASNTQLAKEKVQREDKGWSVTERKGHVLARFLLFCLLTGRNIGSNIILGVDSAPLFYSFRPLAKHLCPFKVFIGLYMQSAAS